MKCKGKPNLYHAPVNLLQSGIAVEADTDTRNKVAHGQSQDTDVIQPQPKIRYAH